ncbi:PglL family O-oligosaccharyltransferase [Acidovorax sp. NCPPB 4044]|uniref:PglL family O-oligosaccharyltransferase n=1 Tax=Acidovorax sp. NCPPB 4044 TaxID=2940490 RepID=UPI0023029A61|nr:Wzy polymerase domain-containing protein [Acidovorax sp. NCPPB 4044]MDA8523467.1 Wzy polymerase domain-containing protein [Acidovorax sp. NCPPB 4044]
MSSFKSLRMIFGHASLLLAWIAPDQIPPWSTYHHEFFMVVGVFLLMPWRHLQVFPPRIAALLLLWVACIFLQGPMHGLPRDDMAAGLVFAVLFGMAAQQGAQAAVKGSYDYLAYSVRSWCLVILVAASISAVIGLAQWTGASLGLWMLESGGRAYANFGQPNHFATLLVMAVAVLVYLDGRGSLNRWVLVGIALLLSCALAVSESRTGGLSLAFLCLLLVVFGRRAGLSKTLWWLLPCFLVFLLIYINLDRIAPWLGGTALRTGIGLNPTGRLEIWKQMLWSLQQEPWAGFGWLRLGASHFAAASVFPSILNIDHAHNLLLDLLLWFGIPLGGLLVVAGGVWCVRTAIDALGKQISKDSLCYAAILLPIAVHSMLEYPYAYLYFSLTAGFFAGALEAEIGAAREISKNGTRIWQGMVLVTLAACTFIAMEYSKIEKDYRALRLENQFITSAEQRHAYHSPPLLLTQYGELIASQRNDAQAPDEGKSPELARRLAERFPWLSTHLHYYLALIRKDRCQEAAEQWKVYGVLFGRFGVLKAEEQIEKWSLQAACPASRAEAPKP